MFDNKHYVPILKWRQGERLGMQRLSTSIKSWCTPLFELPTEPWDFDTESAAKSLDEHIEKFGRRLFACWGTSRSFFDSCHVAGTATCADGRHHLVHLFELARADGAQALPVTGLRRAAEYQLAVKAIISVDDRGCCLRLSLEDFDATLPSRITKLLKLLKVVESEVDLIIDAEDEISTVATAQASVWASLLMQLPSLVKWRTVTVAGTSFPAALSPSENFRPHGTLDRREWHAYKALVANPLNRIPTFGDYATSAPKTAFLDPRLIDANARVKYTITDKWLIAVGTKVKKYGRGQYQALCQAIVSLKPKVFDGAAYSWGDNFINDCAAGKGNGGTSTWPTVATNRHATKVVRDVANLFGASNIP